MNLTDVIQINGQPIVTPDEDAEWSYSDLDSSDSGRDESGVMQREVVRRKVGTLGLNYSALTDKEYEYMVNLLDADTFAVTRPRRGSSTETETVTCYCSKYSISWHNARTGLWKNLKFNIIEC